MTSDSLLLNLLIKGEARINELEAQLESERVLSTQRIQELTKEVEFLRVSNCPPPRENQPAAHVDDNLSTFSIIQQLAKEKDELAGQLETAKKQNIELGAVLTQQQAILVGVTTKNNDLQAALLKELETRKELENEYLKGVDRVKECVIKAKDEEETKFRKMVAEKDAIIVELEKKLDDLAQKYNNCTEMLGSMGFGNMGNLQENKEWNYQHLNSVLPVAKDSVLERLKDVEETKNEISPQSDIDRQRAQIKKIKREAYINKLIRRYMDKFARIRLGENEMPLEEQARNMAEKEFLHQELGEELRVWENRMYSRVRNHSSTSHYYPFWYR